MDPFSQRFSAVAKAKAEFAGNKPLHFVQSHNQRTRQADSFNWENSTKPSQA